MSLNVPRTRELLQNFDFPRLFIEELGWSNPASRQAVNSQLSTKNLQLNYCGGSSSTVGLVSN